MVSVFIASDAGELAFIKSLFQANNIEFIVQNEHLNSINPFIQFAMPIDVMVCEKDAEAAREIIKQYDEDRGVL